MPSIVDEPAVLAFLERAPGTDRLQPGVQRRPTAATVDDEVGPDRPSALGQHSGDPRRSPWTRVGAEAGDRDTPPDLQTRRTDGNGRHRRLQNRSPRRHRVEPRIGRPHRPAYRLRQRGDRVACETPDPYQLREYLGKFHGHLLPPARQQEVRQAELVDTVALP